MNENSKHHGHSDLQSGCVEWFSYQYNDIKDLLFAIPNGIPIYNQTIRIQIYNRLVKEGLKKGAPDLFLAIPNNNFHGLFIEVKYGNDKLRNEQKKIISQLELQGYKCIVIYSFEDFQKEIIDYLKCG